MGLAHQIWMMLVCIRYILPTGKFSDIYFRLLTWTYLTELLTYFGIESLYEINRKRSKLISSNLGCKFDEVVFLTLYILLGEGNNLYFMFCIVVDIHN